jgi:hypothetical protein
MNWHPPDLSDMPRGAAEEEEAGSLRSLLPWLVPFLLGALLALYLALAFDDKKAGTTAIMLVVACALAAFFMREEIRDRALGPRLAVLAGGQSLAPHWAREILGPWWSNRRPFYARWIVAREESWGSLYLLRMVVGKNAHETNLVLSVQGRELPTLRASRHGAPQSELVGELEQWDVHSQPGADERLVQRIVETVQVLEVAAFQVDGRKLWCRVRDRGVALFGSNAAERQQALATLLARAAEVGRDLRRLQE